MFTPRRNILGQAGTGHPRSGYVTFLHHSNGLTVSVLIALTIGPHVRCGRHTGLVPMIGLSRALPKGMPLQAPIRILMGDIPALLQIRGFTPIILTDLTLGHSAYHQLSTLSLSFLTDASIELPLLQYEYIPMDFLHQQAPWIRKSQASGRIRFPYSHMNLLCLFR